MLKQSTDAEKTEFKIFVFGFLYMNLVIRFLRKIPLLAQATHANEEGISTKGILSMFLQTTIKVFYSRQSFRISFQNR